MQCSGISGAGPLCPARRVTGTHEVRYQKTKGSRQRSGCLAPAAAVNPEPKSSVSKPGFQGTTTKELTEWLELNGVNTSCYGQGTAKTVADLLEESQKFESVLEVDDGKALRVVRILSLHIINETGKVLYEEEQVLPDGRSRRRNLPLSEKLMGTEQWREAVERAVREEMGSILPSGYDVTVHDDTYRILSEYCSSMSYPGLLTKYICHRVDVNITGLPDYSFSTYEPRVGGQLTTHWVWRSVEECDGWW